MIIICHLPLLCLHTYSFITFTQTHMSVVILYPLALFCYDARNLILLTYMYLCVRALISSSSNFIFKKKEYKGINNVNSSSNHDLLNF